VTLTLDDLETDIVMNDSSTLTNTTIWFVAGLSLIVDVRTYIRTFLPGLLGNLWGDDLKMCVVFHMKPVTKMEIHYEDIVIEQNTDEENVQLNW